MQVHVIDANNRSQYAAQLDEHHIIRRDIYIGEHNWRALTSIDGREYDQFDLPDAVYLLALTDDGRVAGGGEPTKGRASRPEAAPGATGWSGGEAGVTREEERKSPSGAASPQATGLDPPKTDGGSTKR